MDFEIIENVITTRHWKDLPSSRFWLQGEWKSQVLEQQFSVSDDKVAQDTWLRTASSDPGSQRMQKLSIGAHHGCREIQRCGRQWHLQQPQQAWRFTEVWDRDVLFSAAVLHYKRKTGSAWEGKQGLVNDCTELKSPNLKTFKVLRSQGFMFDYLSHTFQDITMCKMPFISRER